ncbi:hypothetical protein FKM82_027564, partial [Ascaphus truei]
AYELSTLTGTQVLLLVASETGHVYTFATRKLQPMITSETGKALIQTCLNSPDSPPRSDPSTDQRMSATGFEETDLTYQVSESDSSGETKPPGVQTASRQLLEVHSALAPHPVIAAACTHARSLSQLRSTFYHPGIHPAWHASRRLISFRSLTSPVTLPAAIMTSSVPTTVGGHMMYPGSHTVMYAPTQGLTDGGLTVLNAFSGSSMQGVVQQFSSQAPSRHCQIPFCASQLHQMAVIGQQSGGGSSNLTELQVVNLDTSHNSKND